MENKSAKRKMCNQSDEKKEKKEPNVNPVTRRAVSKEHTKCVDPIIRTVHRPTHREQGVHTSCEWRMLKIKLFLIYISKHLPLSDADGFSLTTSLSSLVDAVALDVKCCGQDCLRRDIFESPGHSDTNGHWCNCHKPRSRGQRWGWMNSK